MLTLHFFDILKYIHANKKKGRIISFIIFERLIRKTVKGWDDNEIARGRGVRVVTFILINK
jgi:hypothetical protein